MRIAGAEPPHEEIFCTGLLHGAEAKRRAGGFAYAGKDRVSEENVRCGKRYGRIASYTQGLAVWEGRRA